MLRSLVRGMDSLWAGAILEGRPSGFLPIILSMKGGLSAVMVLLMVVAKVELPGGVKGPMLAVGELIVNAGGPPDVAIGPLRVSPMLAKVLMASQVSLVPVGVVSSRGCNE